MKHIARQYDLLPAEQTPFSLIGETETHEPPKKRDDTPALLGMPPSFKPKTRVNVPVNIGLFKKG